jgi:hypothetical protein
MIKKSLLALIALLMMLSCTGQSKVDNNSLLWKISGNGLEKPSFLFGTHHLIPITFLDSVPGLKTAFENTEQVVGELDMSNMSEMQMKIMSESMLPEGVTYESLMPQEDIELLDSTLRNLVGAGLDQLGIMKPALLSNLISITLYQKFYPTLSNEISMDSGKSIKAYQTGDRTGINGRSDSNITKLANSGTSGRDADVYD